MAATNVPAKAHTASVLSAPKRRNQRNPYTDATALPTGNELVMAWDPKDSLTSGVHGARRCPALRSSYCIAAKHRYEPISAAMAGPAHHQSNEEKIVPKPESSDVLAPRTHTTTTTRPRLTMHAHDGPRPPHDAPRPRGAPYVSRARRR